MSTILHALWLVAVVPQCLAQETLGPRALLATFLDQNDSNLTDDPLTETTTSSPSGEAMGVDFGYLNPGGNSTCPAKCKNYFAGAHSSDAFVCQKQASGVGTSQQNVENGVTCFPAYGCGKDMITCVNQEQTSPLPNMSDVVAACAGLDSLVRENPHECGTVEEGRVPCQHNISNSAEGKWLKASGWLDCGWGSTYGNTGPGSPGAATPATVLFEGITSDYDCCVKAMQFENTPFKDGGSAIFFQQGRNIYGQTGDYCRVDREKIIYGNMDSSSGRSIKYQGTRCGADDSYLYYRHSAGAADAANLHTGGRCVKEGNFSRVASFNPGSNLPAGELPEGQELPNHACPDDPTGYGPWDGCHVSMRINTINDAEECCKMCSSLSWLGDPDIKGNADVDENNVHVNPCVSWQIVEGRCRLTRKAYFDHWNPNMTIKDSILQTDFDGGLGNADWRIHGRGCGDSAENCNHYSYIYYREAGVPPSSDQKNASFRKLVKVEQDLLADTSTIHIQVAVNSLDGRHDTRAGLTTEQKPVEMESGNGTDCGQLEIFLASDVMTTGSSGYDEFDEEIAPTPVCKSECITSGQNVLFSCDLTTVATTSAARRLSTPDIILSASSVGSGYDSVDFGSMAMYKALPPPSPPPVVEDNVSSGNKESSNGSSAGNGSSASDGSSAGDGSSDANSTGNAGSNGSSAGNAGSDGSSSDDGTSEPQKTVTVSGESTLTVADAAAFVADPSAKKGVQNALASKVGVEPEAVTVELSVISSRRLDGRLLQSESVLVEFEIAMIVASQQATSKGAELVSSLQSIDTAELASAIVAEIETLSGEVYEVQVAAFNPDTSPVIEDVEGDDSGSSTSAGDDSGSTTITGVDKIDDESEGRLGCAPRLLTLTLLALANHLS